MITIHAINGLLILQKKLLLLGQLEYCSNPGGIQFPITIDLVDVVAVIVNVNSEVVVNVLVIVVIRPSAESARVEATYEM